MPSLYPPRKLAALPPAGLPIRSAPPPVTAVHDYFFYMCPTGCIYFRYIHGQPAGDKKKDRRGVAAVFVEDSVLVV